MKQVIRLVPHSEFFLPSLDKDHLLAFLLIIGLLVAQGKQIVPGARFQLSF